MGKYRDIIGCPHDKNGKMMLLENYFDTEKTAAERKALLFTRYPWTMRGEHCFLLTRVNH